MSHYDFEVAMRLATAPFAALIMAASLKADNDNLQALRRAFPALVDEATARYNAPGGVLPTDVTR